MLEKGDILKNRYRISKVLNSGESTIVYLVEDTSSGNEYVLKEFIINLNNPREITIAIQKFEKDLESLTGFSHPGLPEIVDHFSYVDRQYLVMEYVRGESLAHTLEEAIHPLSDSSALKIGIQTASILYALHKQNPPFLFRVLEPSNIFITEDEKVKLLDFGLERHFRSIRDPRSRKRGAPGYMPPEQFGEGLCSIRTDIYALGAIMHQMLTLRNPARISNVFRFPPISEINSNASKKLEEIVDRATRYQPAERYQTVLEMKREMEKVLADREGRASEKHKASAKAKTNRPTPISNVEEYLAQPTREIPLPKPAKLPDPRQADKKRGFPVKIVAIFGIIILIAVMAFVFLSRSGKQTGTDNGDSPFSISTDTRVTDLREEGIANYNEGVQTGDTGKLALCIQQLQKVVTARPTDSICQIYMENATMLLQKHPYRKVATLLSMSGVDFESGMQMLAGVALAQTIHNRNEKTDKILIELYDDKTRVEECVKIATELSRRDDIFAVIGPIRTPFLSATAPIFSANSIVQISPTGLCAGTENLGDSIYRLSGKGSEQAEDIAGFAENRLNLKKVAVIFDSTHSYSKIMGEIFDNQITRSGKVKTRRFNANIEDMDFTGLISQIKQFNPDGIFFIAYYDQEAVFAKQALAEGLKAVHLATVAAYSQRLLILGGPAVEGLIFYSYYFPTDKAVGSRKFTDQFREKYSGVDPNFRAAMAYDTLLILSSALENRINDSTGLDRFLKEVLGKRVKLSGASGPISFDKNGIRQGLSLVYITVKNGQFALYEKKSSR